MKRAKNFHRRRPHILPPLPSLGPSVFRPMDPLQPPDFFSGNRLGSPAPKRTMPFETDDILISNHGKPIITIFEPCLKETEKCKVKVDMMSDEIFQDGSDYNNQIKNKNFLSAGQIDLASYDGENPLMKNNRKKQQLEHLCDGLEKKLKTQDILPLEETENLKTLEFKVLQIPNRYKPLKPIGQKTEN